MPPKIKISSSSVIRSIPTEVGVKAAKIASQVLSKQ